MVKTLSFHSRGTGLIPGQGTKTHVQRGKRQKEKKEGRRNEWREGGGKRERQRDRNGKKGGREDKESKKEGRRPERPGHSSSLGCARRGA